MKVATVAAAAVLLASFAGAEPLRAQATDFTITVPVDVSGLPSTVTEMMVNCYVAPENYGDARNYIAFAGRRFAVSGTYRANLTLTVNALPGKDPALARWYSCDAQFVGTERGVPTTFFAGGGTTPPVFPLVVGAPFNLGSTGRWTRIPGIR